MNAKILYATMTGHSRKIAKAISQKLDIPAFDLKSKPDIGHCDLLFIVSGIYGGESKPELLEFVKSLSPDRVKQVCLICTSLNTAPQGSLRKTLENCGISVMDEYQGIGGFLVAKMFRPNKADIEAAVSFAEGVMQRA